jgi:hypothetical protein
MNSQTSDSQSSALHDRIIVPADKEHGDTTAAAHRVTISPSERIDISQIPIAQELTVTLNDILGRYIDQLYSAGHGGLSLEEETVIYRARHLLARVGLNHHEPTVQK